MKIHFAVQCHKFERRLAWQLSSIDQQVGRDTPEIPHQTNIARPAYALPEITIDVSYMPHHSEPSIEYVLRSFPDLDIVHTVLTDRNVFAQRGLVRNIQMENANDADWVFFGDCDNIYHPHFFAELGHRLESCTERRTYYSRDKHHTETEPTDAACREALINPRINYAYKRAMALPRIDKKNKKVAAGCCQIVKPEWCDGYYVKRANDRHLFDQGQRARSDIRFRKRIGDSFDLCLPVQVHMGHRRDKEEGRHLEEQR